MISPGTRLNSELRARREIFMRATISSLLPSPMCYTNNHLIENNKFFFGKIIPSTGGKCYCLACPLLAALAGGGWGGVGVPGAQSCSSSL